MEVKQNPTLDDLKRETETLKEGIDFLTDLIDGRTKCHRISVGVGEVEDKPEVAQRLVTLRANKFPHLDILGRQVAASMVPMMKAQYAERLKVYEDALKAELEKVKK